MTEPASSPPSSPPLFAHVGRTEALTSRRGGSIRFLLLCIALGLGVAFLDEALKEPPEIRPVAVRMMAEEAADAAESVEAEGGLRPMPSPKGDAP